MNTNPKRLIREWEHAPYRLLVFEGRYPAKNGKTVLDGELYFEGKLTLAAEGFICPPQYAPASDEAAAHVLDCLNTHPRDIIGSEEERAAFQDELSSEQLQFIDEHGSELLRLSDELADAVNPADIERIRAVGTEFGFNTKTKARIINVDMDNHTLEEHRRISDYLVREGFVECRNHIWETATNGKDCKCRHCNATKPED